MKRSDLFPDAIRRDFWKDPAAARRKIKKDPRLATMFGDGPPRKLPADPAVWTPMEAKTEAGKWVRRLKKHVASAERDAALDALRSVKSGDDYATALVLVQSYVFAGTRE